MAESSAAAPNSNSTKQQQAMKVLESLEHMTDCGMAVSRDDVYGLFEAFGDGPDLHFARRMHALMSKNSLFPVTALSDRLIRLLTACGSSDKAIVVFHKVPNPTAYTCNAAMAAYTKLGKPHKVFHLYHRMKTESIQEDNVTLLSLLKACGVLGDPQAARHIHIYMLVGGLERPTYIGNSIVDLYAKCSSLDDAHRVFERLPHKTDVSWGALLTGYSDGGYALNTFELFDSMKKHGLKPSRVAYLCVLKASGSIQALDSGRLLHKEIILDRLEQDAVVGSNLVTMYSKCDSLEDASRIFRDLSAPDFVAWSAIIVAHAQHQQGGQALELFQQMQKAGLSLNEVAFSAVLKACAGIGAIRQGQDVHDSIIKCGFAANNVLGSSLVDMYAKCDRLTDASNVFDGMAHRDVVTWGAMMAGYAHHGRGHAALDLLMRMKRESIKPGKAIFLSALKACSSLGVLDQGRLLHSEIIEYELDHDSAILNTLVDMYAKCGSLEEGQHIFDETSQTSIVAWGAMINGLVMQRCAVRALELFSRMHSERLPMNEVIYSGALRACGISSMVDQGMLIHACVLQSEFCLDVVVEGTLVDMYVRCERLEDAFSVFNCLSTHDIVSWGTLMMGFTDAGDGLSVMELMRAMLKEGLMPDKVTLICGVKACGMLGVLEWGNWVYAALVEVNLESDLVLGTVLIDMYCKCDSMEDGCRVFYGMPERDTQLWGSLISGYAAKGNFAQVHASLFDMQKQGLMPSDVIVTSILSACGQGGFLEEGFICFRTMIEGFGVFPTDEHCGCMVDLFARVGRLDDASDLSSTLDFCDAVVIRSLLSSCKTYEKSNLATRSFEYFYDE